MPARTGLVRRDSPIRCDVWQLLFMGQTNAKAVFCLQLSLMFAESPIYPVWGLEIIELVRTSHSITLHGHSITLHGHYIALHDRDNLVAFLHWFDQILSSEHSHHNWTAGYGSNPGQKICRQCTRLNWACVHEHF